MKMQISEQMVVRKYPFSQRTIDENDDKLSTECAYACRFNKTIFNKIAIQPTAQMAADKEAVGLSRVHMYESKCILPY